MPNVTRVEVEVVINGWILHIYWTTGPMTCEIYTTWPSTKQRIDALLDPTP